MKTIRTEKELQQFISTINTAKSEAMTEKTDRYGSANIVGKELLEILKKHFQGSDITAKEWYSYSGLKLTDKCFNGVDIVFVYNVSYYFDYRNLRGSDNYERIYTEDVRPVIRYKDLLLSFSEEQKGRIKLWDFDVSVYSDFLDKYSENAPNLIGSMTPKKLEQWYQYICDKRNAALQKQQEAKEKISSFVGKYENETGVHWRSDNHTSGYIERNGIRHAFQIDKYGYEMCKNEVIPSHGDIEVFKQLASGTFRG
ncbi:hypothetical protein [Prevotella melaninogenica]|uniref:hypothetical protein n=1 Tax=Prevotella melaninogenica TaxID=28132 RepID=UPI001BAE4E03|nr:hypothetical protein [Prevotella melaninogenica]QUB66115.1 hypothetical protein J5A57_03190 [Prevotella melaninogenica]